VTDAEREHLRDVELVAGPRFEVVRSLGRGAMGEVVEAFDRFLDRRVALKVTNEELRASPQFHARFEREGRAVAALDHPNVVRVYDVDPHGGFLVLELVEGESLRERLGRLRVEKDDAIRIARDVSAGLAAAHRAGIVHRDLKPANVLLGSDGMAKVSDFGVARVIDSELTETGEVLGTPSYMSPEQLRGARQVDARSDVYAVGLLLFEMLVGRRYHDPDRPPVTPGPAIVQATSDRALAALVARCLEENREKRPPTAEALIEALDEVARPNARRRVAKGVFVAMIVAAVAVSVFVVEARRRGRSKGTPAPAPSDSSLVVSPLPLFAGASPNALPDLRRAVTRLYALDIAGADAALSALVIADPTWSDALYYVALSRSFGIGDQRHVQAALENARKVTQPPARRAMLAAMEAYERGDFAAISKEVRPLIAQTPDDWELLFALGEGLTHEGDLDEGYRTFERGHAKNPRFLLPWSHVTEMALARGDGAAIERWASSLESSKAGHALGIANRMHWRIAQGDAKGALSLAGDDATPTVVSVRIGALALLDDFDSARRLSVEGAGGMGPDAQTLAWLAFAQARNAEWLRWMDQAADEVALGRLSNSGLVLGEQAIAYYIANEVERGDKALERARLASGEATVPRAVALARVLRAFRKSSQADLPTAKVPAAPEVDAAAEGVKHALEGRIADAVKSLERALAVAGQTQLLVPIAWLGATIAREDVAAHDRFCTWIVRPRHVFWSWAYARPICAK